MTEPGYDAEENKKHLDLPEDEIDLFELLRIIWKWKYLIIIGTAACVLAVWMFSLTMQPIYQVGMVIKSGLNKVDSEGKPVYSDSVGEFKSLIESGLLYKDIDHSVYKLNKGTPSSRAYKIRAENYTNTLRVLYETNDKEEGIEHLNNLLIILTQRYQNRLKQLQDNFEYELRTAERQLAFSIDEEKFITSKLNDIQEKLDRFTQESETLNGPDETHAKSQKRLLIYSSIVENVADLKRKHAQAGWQTDFFKNEIADLKKNKPREKAIIVDQPPTGSQHPIKPKKIQYVILAIIAGLFFMIFLSFFIEYISKHKR